uniref:Ig-like domain-containing protein n=1 Tax=Cacopsylla melanoneura TaxID=428564 RepID=A0A8D9F1S6_9HEMI
MENFQNLSERQLKLAIILMNHPFRVSDIKMEVVSGGVDEETEFINQLSNISVAEGQEILLSCAVAHLGIHQVGWIRVDTGTILTVLDKTTITSRRINVSNKNRHFQLHIHKALQSDEGCYMCQVNANVILRQIGCVHIMSKFWFRV